MFDFSFIIFSYLSEVRLFLNFPIEEKPGNCHMATRPLCKRTIHPAHRTVCWTCSWHNLNETVKFTQVECDHTKITIKTNITKWEILRWIFAVAWLNTIVRVSLFMFVSFSFIQSNFDCSDCYFCRPFIAHNTMRPHQSQMEKRTRFARQIESAWTIGQSSRLHIHGWSTNSTGCKFNACNTFSWISSVHTISNNLLLFHVQVRHRRRVDEQREMAQKIVTGCQEVDFAKERYQRLNAEHAAKRQQIIDNKLKPKGHLLLTQTKWIGVQCTQT